MNTIALIATILGTFSHPHLIRFPGYATEQACVADEGKWEEGTCIFDAEDTITVKQSGKAYSVAISTVGVNAHTCDFDAPATLVRPGELLATAPSHVYENGEAKPATCKVRVKLAANGSVSSTVLGSYETCEEFCGASVGLDVANAIRK